MPAPSPSDVEDAEFDPTTRLGECIAEKWTLEEVLGLGGMAVVYAATHRNGHRTAIKMLLPEIARDESLVRRFLREGYLANKVPHDGAVRVLDDGRALDGCPFLVMERLDGYTLDNHVNGKETPLDMRSAVDLMIELLEITGAAHGVGLVHRDIKPANIFRTKQGPLKLLDFGIALLLESGPRSSGTQSGVIIGTPAYMAPEQARARKELVGPRTDLWAIAACGLSLMVGRRLRDGLTLSEEVAMAALQPLPPAATYGMGLAGSLGNILDRALAFEPRDRFATADSMRDALAACRDGVLPTTCLGPMTLREPSSAPPGTVPLCGAHLAAGRGSDFRTPPAQPSIPPNGGYLSMPPPAQSRSGIAAPSSSTMASATTNVLAGPSPSRAPLFAVGLAIALVLGGSSAVAWKVRARRLATRAEPTTSAPTGSASAVQATNVPPASATAPAASSVIPAASATTSATAPGPRNGRIPSSRPSAGHAPSGGSNAAKPDYMDER